MNILKTYKRYYAPKKDTPIFKADLFGKMSIAQY